MKVNQEMKDESSWICLTLEKPAPMMGFPLRSEFANENHGEARSSKQCNDQCTDQIAFFFGAYHHRFRSKHEKGTLWWEARRCTWNARFGIEQRRWHQDAVQPVEHKSTSPRKCVSQEWSSTGKTADAVGSALQTADCWWPSASAGTRSACRNRHKLVFRSRDTERRVCQNPSRVATLGRTPW